MFGEVALKVLDPEGTNALTTNLVLVPSLRLGIHLLRLCLLYISEAEPPASAFPGRAWEREIQREIQPAKAGFVPIAPPFEGAGDFAGILRTIKYIPQQFHKAFDD